jgi:hypothetical protein
MFMKVCLTKRKRRTMSGRAGASTTNFVGPAVVIGIVLALVAMAKFGSLEPAAGTGAKPPAHSFRDGRSHVLKLSGVWHGGEHYVNPRNVTIDAWVEGLHIPLPQPPPLDPSNREEWLGYTDTTYRGGPVTLTIDTHDPRAIVICDIEVDGRSVIHRRPEDVDQGKTTCRFNA